MDGITTGIITSVGSGIALAVLTWLWLAFSKHGQAFWKKLGTFELAKREPWERATQVLKVEGIRTHFVLTLLALLLSLSALIIALVIRSQSLDVYSGDKVFAYRNPPPDPNWAASGSCPSDSKVIGFYCQIGDEQVNPAGSGNLQNLGVMDGKSFHCLWNNVVCTNFRAWGKPLFLRLKK
jgi:hypothetical protein